MTTQTKTQSAGELACNYFGNGFHCAETIVAACLETLGRDPSIACSHASAFGGGFGKSFEEACGALSGSAIVIGHLMGRQKPGGSWDLPAEYLAELRESFIQMFGTTHCRTLRNRFGENQEAECRKLVVWMVDALMMKLSEQQGDTP